MSDLKNLAFIRYALLATIKDLSVEQLNKTPEGFSNNVIWNFAHCMVSTNSMCYGPSGNDIGISKEMIDKYKRGSKPEGNVSEDEINYWKELATTSVTQMEKDLVAGKFSTYHAWDLSKRTQIASVDDALAFSYFHEGTHLGFIWSIKKFL